jgi:EmrB/QacA subfamily drug resistance transporter
MKNDSVQRNALLIATLSSFLTPFMGSSVIVSLPRIGHDLSMNVITLSWISTAYQLAAAAFLVPFGRLSDIHGRKRIFLLGILLDNLSSLLGAFSTSSGMLITARIFQGMGGAMIFGTSVTIVTSVFPPQQRGRALGITVAGVYAGLSTGPFIGGFLTGHFGWRSVFLSNVLIGIMILVTTLWKLKGEWAEARGEKFDLVGSLIYVVSLVSMMYGLSLVPALPAFILVMFGVTGIACFVVWEMKVGSPVLEMRLFRRSRTFLFSNLAALINYSATFAVTFLMSLYLQYIKGFSPQATGLVLVSQPLIMALFSPLAGRLSDRSGPRIVASVGMAVMVIGLSFFVFLREETRLLYIIPNLMLLGLGFALFSSPNANAIMSSVDKKYFGVAGGMMGTMRLTGQMFSMGVVMVTLAVFHRSWVMITPAYHASLLQTTRTAFTIFALFSFVGVFASLARVSSR